MQPNAHSGPARSRSNTHISELNLSHFPKSTDNLSTNFICNVELGQGHVAGAEEGILGDRHNARSRDVSATKGSTRSRLSAQYDGSLRDALFTERGHRARIAEAPSLMVVFLRCLMIGRRIVADGKEKTLARYGLVCQASKPARIMPGSDCPRAWICSMQNLGQ